MGWGVGTGGAGGCVAPGGRNRGWGQGAGVLGSPGGNESLKSRMKGKSTSRELGGGGGGGQGWVLGGSWWTVARGGGGVRGGGGGGVWSWGGGVLWVFCLGGLRGCGGAV